MQKNLFFRSLVGVLFILAASAVVSAQNSKIAQIPGITAKDSHPNGCVDCHKVASSTKDYRLSTAISEWSEEGADPEILTLAKAAWPKASLSGKHPDVAGMIKSQEVPNVCYTCHGENSSKPLYKVLHTIHYSDSEDNPFILYYQGSCTNCHSLNLDTSNPPTGTMEIKLGKEKI